MQVQKKYSYLLHCRFTYIYIVSDMVFAFVVRLYMMGGGGGAQLCVAMTAITSLKQISYMLMQAQTVRCVCSPTDEKRITCGDV